MRSHNKWTANSTGAAWDHARAQTTCVSQESTWLRKSKVEYSVLTVPDKSSYRCVFCMLASGGQPQRHCKQKYIKMTKWWFGVYATQVTSKCAFFNTCYVHLPVIQDKVQSWGSSVVKLNFLAWPDVACPVRNVKYNVHVVLTWSYTSRMFVCIQWCTSPLCICLIGQQYGFALCFLLNFLTLTWCICCALQAPEHFVGIMCFDVSQKILATESNLATGRANKATKGSLQLSCIAVAKRKTSNSELGLTITSTRVTWMPGGSGVPLTHWKSQLALDFFERS